MPLHLAQFQVEDAQTDGIVGSAQFFMLVGSTLINDIPNAIFGMFHILGVECVRQARLTTEPTEVDE
jgi:hypothetical protein